jgi:hypothetical protein
LERRRPGGIEASEEDGAKFREAIESRPDGHVGFDDIDEVGEGRGRRRALEKYDEELRQRL